MIWLLKETVTTFLDTFIAQLKYDKVIQYKLLDKETSQLSPPINLNNEMYRVARLGPSKFDFKTKSVIDLKGYLVIDSKGNIIQNPDLIKGILPIYELWYYKYLNPTFASAFYHFPKLINSWISTFNKITQSIQKRKERGYLNETKEFDSEYACILEQLDDQVLEHNNHTVKRLEYTKTLLETEKTFFSQLSEEKYDEIFNLASLIRNEAIHENTIWSNRKEIWGTFVNKIRSINQKPSINIDMELMQALALDMIGMTVQIPIGTGYLLLKRKYAEVSKRVKVWYMKDIIEHKFGFVAIEQNIKDNLVLMDKLNIMNSIVEKIDYSKVRY